MKKTRKGPKIKGRPTGRIVKDWNTPLFPRTKDQLPPGKTPIIGPP